LAAGLNAATFLSRGAATRLTSFSLTVDTAERAMTRASQLALFALVLLLLPVGCRTIDGPTPVRELVPEEAAFDPQIYDGSRGPDASVPSVLILGTPHLARDDQDFTEEGVERVANSLSAYSPDMVVVEYLPPDHPRGKGRDYRPDWNLDSYAEAWDMTYEEADSLRRRHQRTDEAPIPPCTLAKAYLLNNDPVNAHYYARPHECPDLRESEEIREWMDRNARDETARIGYPVARQNDVSKLVPFDYQGDDAEWFIQYTLLDAIKSGKVWALWNFWPVVPRVGSTYQEDRAHGDNYQDCYAGELRFSNSPEWIGLQYWAYEEEIRSIDWESRSIGRRQVENYWRRNRKMFERMQEAIEAQDPKRVLVIVGSGHKYFLDELTREAGYRWVDPRKWLPASCSGTMRDRAAAE
jgi:hypothetical protein